MSTEDGNGDSGDGVECPTCQRRFKNQQGMKSHHTKIHGESIAGVVVGCGWCGGEKRVTPSKAKRHQRHFCSNDCHNEWLSDRTGREHPLWKEKVALDCEECGGTFHRHESQVDRSRFCSKACLVAWHARYIAGENHPRWVGGKAPYGVGFTEKKRERIRERQGRECLGCKKDEAENGRRLSVHHIVKSRALKNTPPEIRHADGNLVALCQSCHRQWEKMSPLRPQVGGD